MTAKLVLLATLAAGVAAVLASQPKAERRRGASGTGRAQRAPLRVVVVGAGFGGLEAAKPMAGKPGIDLTLIDAENHHLFQPLLYQVATAALTPADIAAPLRGMVPVSGSVRVLMETVTGLDAGGRQVLCGDHAVPYDRLVIATGSTPSYFGHDEWAGIAPGLKTLGDALRVRSTIISAFERAATLAAKPDEQERFLTFVLIGGGPTGVEMAGAIAEFVRDRLQKAYDIPAERARVILVEAGPRVLAEFAPNLSAHATAALHGLGVDVRTGTRVTGISPGQVQLGDQAITAETVIWAAGMAATPAATWLGVKPGHGGRVEVGPDLRVPGHDGVFVIGDAALARDAQGQPLPGIAPVAKQQGKHVAGTILREARGAAVQAPFRYRDYGILATVGRNEAVAQFGPVHISGFPAWLLWAGAHILFLISFRSRVIVSLEWAFAYVTHGRSAGLIIGDAGAPGVLGQAKRAAG